MRGFSLTRRRVLPAQGVPSQGYGGDPFSKVFMKKGEELSIFKKAYQLTLTIYKCTELFPKHERFLLTARFKDICLEILSGIVQANEARVKSVHLERVSQEVEKLRILIRLSRDLKYLSFKKYENLSEEINEVGRMLGGWIRYSAKR